MPVNSRLKATKIIDQRKTFYRQRIQESSCTRKETVDIDIFVTSRNSDRKIMQSIRPTLRKRTWNQLSQFWRTSIKVITIDYLLLVSLKSPLNWSKIWKSLLLQNNKIVKRENFVTSIKIFTQNNLIISIVLTWYLPMVNLLCICYAFQIFFVNDTSSVTLYYMVLMLCISLERITFSRICGVQNS